MAYKKIGFLGLGAMGFPMAENLLKKGFDLQIAAHRNRTPVEQLKQAGAVEHSSLSELAAHSEILISILPADKEMESVLLSKEILEHLSPEATLIEMTSGSSSMMKRVNQAFQEKGIRVLDGPVSGGTAGAEQGTLTVMVGGDSDVMEDVKPVLEAMAENIYLVGTVGAGKAIKAINQMMAGVHMIASAEAIALAEKLGIDKEKVKEVIGSSSGSSWMLLNKIDSVSNRDFDAGFKLKLMKKDMQIAIVESGELRLPITDAALALYGKAERESGNLDFSAISMEILSSNEK